jgi:hypothetical protein
MNAFNGNTSGSGNVFGGMFNPATANQTNLNNDTQNIAYETLYKDLPPVFKLEIDRTYNEFKKPMRLKLEEISCHRGSMYDELKVGLKKIHSELLKIENKQTLLLREIKPFLEETKSVTKNARTYGAIGMQQVKSRGGGLAGGTFLLLDESLPNNFYVQVAEKLEKRINSCIQEVNYFNKQLLVKIRAMESLQSKNVSQQKNRGAYGQVVSTTIGARQLLDLLKTQVEAFTRVAAHVAHVHRDTEELKLMFLSHYSVHNKNHEQQTFNIDASNSITSSNNNYISNSNNNNPFEAADRKEAAEKRISQQKMKSETFKFNTASSSTTNVFTNNNFNSNNINNNNQPTHQQQPTLNFLNIKPTSTSAFQLGNNSFGSTNNSIATPLTTTGTFNLSTTPLFPSTASSSALFSLNNNNNTSNNTNASSSWSIPKSSTFSQPATLPPNFDNSSIFGINIGSDGTIGSTSTKNLNKKNGNKLR